MKKRSATTNQNPNPPKLRTVKEEEDGFGGGRNNPISQPRLNKYNPQHPAPPKVSGIYHSLHPAPPPPPKVSLHPAPPPPKVSLHPAPPPPKVSLHPAPPPPKVSLHPAPPPPKVSSIYHSLHPAPPPSKVSSIYHSLHPAPPPKVSSIYHSLHPSPPISKKQKPSITQIGQSSHPLKKKKPSITETGQSSNLGHYCKICMEAKRPTEIFTIKACGHVFCSECINQHVEAKIQEKSPAVQCPEPSCKEVLDPVSCQRILPRAVFVKWGGVMSESSIPESKKFYCPFKDCSGLLVDERAKDGEVILESECPHCRRLFCARCKVPWHSEISCADFQKLGKHERDREDIMLMNLAKNKKWQRCPQCGFYVERIDGCLFMKCRCGYNFCYRCGGPSDPKYHYCQRCRR